jgi:DNA-binding NtrC family response regulator
LAPLRKRKEEIPQFVDLFIKKFCLREKKKIKEVTNEFLEFLTKYNFPGNIRELENIIERAIVLSENKVLSADDLPPEVISFAETYHPTSLLGTHFSLPKLLCKIEKRILIKTLQKCNYHQTKTAIALGISEARLRYKIKTLGIPRKK